MGKRFKNFITIRNSDKTQPQMPDKLIMTDKQIKYVLLQYENFREFRMIRVVYYFLSIKF